MRLNASSFEVLRGDPGVEGAFDLVDLLQLSIADWTDTILFAENSEADPPFVAGNRAWMAARTDEAGRGWWRSLLRAGD